MGGISGGAVHLAQSHLKITSYGNANEKSIIRGEFGLSSLVVRLPVAVFLQPHSVLAQVIFTIKSPKNW